MDYMECRLTAAVTNTEDCGCDTKLAKAVAKESSNAVPLHQHQLKNYTEEFFQLTNTAEPVATINYSNGYSTATDKPILDMAYSIFQPPRI